MIKRAFWIGLSFLFLSGVVYADFDTKVDSRIVDRYSDSTAMTVKSLADSNPAAVAVVDASGDQITSFGGATLGTTSTVTSVADTASSTTLIASNTSRKQVSIANDSSAALYVLLGSGTASATNYTYRLAQYDAAIINSYSGQINGIWASHPGDGAARIDEVT